jgi:O-antigen ligase
MNVLFFGFILWFGSYADSYVFSLGGPKPLYSYFLLLGIACLYALQRAAIHRPLLVERSKGVGPFLIWLCAYAVYGAIAFLRSTGDSVAVQALITLGEMVLLAGTFAVLMATPRRLRIAATALALLALVGSVINLIDFIHPTFSITPGRAAGLYLNPTISGNVLAFAMVAGMTVVRRQVALLFALLCGTGVLLTFSRESWLIWGLAVMWLGWQGHFSHRRQRLLMFMLALLIGGGFTGLLFAGRVGAFVADSTVLEAYLTPDAATRLGIGGSTLSGTSAEARHSLIFNSLREAEASPWLGHGLGYTREWKYPQGPHDMYLLFLVEGGMLGAALYVCLMILLWRAGVGVGRVIVVQIAISSVFSHNHLEQTAIVMILAFVFAHCTVFRADAGEPVRFLSLGIHPKRLRVAGGPTL